jgi:hypothetical protein
LTGAGFFQKVLDERMGIATFLVTVEGEVAVKGAGPWRVKVGGGLMVRGGGW